MIHRAASAERLAVLRVVVFAVWFGRIATTPVQNYALLPEELIEPVGITRALPLAQMLGSAPLMRGLQLCALVLCLLCVIGVRPWRAVAIPAVVLIVLHDGAMKSIQGFVNHGQAALLLAAIFLTAAPAADAFSIRGRYRGPTTGRSYGGPLVATATVITLAYSFIGLRRLIYGGWQLFTDGSVLAWMVGRSDQYAAYDLGIPPAATDLTILAVLLSGGMFVVTLFEITSPAALADDRFRRAWLAVMVPFHVSTLFLMNIFFWENLLLIAVLFTRLTPTAAPDDTSATERHLPAAVRAG